MIRSCNGGAARRFRRCSRDAEFRIDLILALLGLVARLRPAAAQQPSADAARRRRAGRRAAAGPRRTPAEIFTPAFLAQVPEAQVARDRPAARPPNMARPGASPRSSRSRASAGTIHIETERAILHMNLVVEPRAAAPDHRPAADRRRHARRHAWRRCLHELRALPGQVSVAVARLGDGAPALIASASSPTGRCAIGSAFKLWILAELSRQVRAGERRWSDVVTLDRRSIPGGTLLQLAAGRAGDPAHARLADDLDQRQQRHRHPAAHARPRECRADDGDGSASPARRATGRCCRRWSWRRSRPARRRRSTSGGRPTRPGGGACSRPIMRRPTRPASTSAASPAIRSRSTSNGSPRPPIWCGRWTGCGATATTPRGRSWRSTRPCRRPSAAASPISATRRLRARRAQPHLAGPHPAGRWHVVTGSWNNPAAPVDEARFVALMARAIQLLR